MQPKSQISLIPQPGERSLIVGQTGSGKTGFAIWMLRRMQQAPQIIYDTKDESKFVSGLKHSTVVHNMRDAGDAIAKGEHDYIIVRPSVHILRDPDELDDLLFYHHLHFPNVPAYVDEAYSFHSSGRAGPGLVALLTRGRARGQTTILSSQKPKWISTFSISEAQRIYSFFLGDMKDKLRLADVIPGFADLIDPPEHGFYFHKVGSRVPPTMYGALKLDRTLHTGYTDIGPTSDASPANAANSRVWI